MEQRAMTIAERTCERAAAMGVSVPEYVKRLMADVGPVDERLIEECREFFRKDQPC